MVVCVAVACLVGSLSAPAWGAASSLLHEWSGPAQPAGCHGSQAQQQGLPEQHCGQSHVASHTWLTYQNASNLNPTNHWHAMLNFLLGRRRGWQELWEVHSYKGFAVCLMFWCEKAEPLLSRYRVVFVPLWVCWKCGRKTIPCLCYLWVMQYESAIQNNTALIMYTSRLFCGECFNIRNPVIL